MFTLIPPAPVLLLLDKIKTLNAPLISSWKSNGQHFIRSKQHLEESLMKKIHISFLTIISQSYWIWANTEVSKIYTLWHSPLAEWESDCLDFSKHGNAATHQKDCAVNWNVSLSRWLPQMRPSLYAVSPNRQTVPLQTRIKKILCYEKYFNNVFPHKMFSKTLK